MPLHLSDSDTLYRYTARCTPLYLANHCMLHTTAHCTPPHLHTAPPAHRPTCTPLHSVLDWQIVGAKAMFRHYLKSDSYLASTIEHCRSVLCTFVTLEMLFLSPSDK